jgi:ligand-binding sensor domain-containing protein/tRNA A-37 threonylcarbamoyl transferase component Bud32
MHQYTGKRLGAYQLIEQIGQGGMATIFKSYQPSMDRYVAVKILPSHFTQDETFSARFMQEARTLARLEHPHILPVHDYGEQDGITYLVMRYIEAGTLKDLIARQGPLDLREAERIIDQVGRALSYAHSQGIVHRDIKPSNVLIDERGDAFLTDFGIAKLVAGTAQFTTTGAIVGTPAYMSPEQGLAQRVDARSDIYALGVVLYEIVTGQVPFEAETPLAVLLKHVNDPLPPPRQIKPDLPEPVERVILKAMAKSPDDRFQTADEMIEALHRAVLNATAAAPTVPAVPVPVTADVRADATADVTVRQPTPARKQTPRDATPPNILPWVLVLGGIVALAIAAIGVVFLLTRSDGGGSEKPVAQETRAASATESAIALAKTASAAVTVESPTAVQPTNTPTQLPSTPEPVVAPTPLGGGALQPGWTSFTNSNSVTDLALQDGYLWAGGDGGLVRWDLQDGDYRKFGVTDGLPSNRVNDLLVDPVGILWVATDAGVGRFDGESWRTFDETDGLDTQWVQSLAVDDEGHIWAGTAYGEQGLNVYDGTRWAPPPFPPLPVEFPSVNMIVFDEDIGVLVALDWEGLAAYDGGEEWEHVTSDDELISDQVYGFLMTEDEVYIAFDMGVMRVDLDSGDWETVPQLEYHTVYAMHQARDGSLWFVGSGGATRYDPVNGDWQQFDRGPREISYWEVTDIVEDEQVLWFGTYEGLASYDGVDWKAWTTDDEIGANAVYAIRQDGSGALWFVHSDGVGLSRYNAADGTWQRFGEAEGALDWLSLPGVDAEGHLWIGDYGELKWFDGSTWQSFTPFELEDVSIYAIDFDADDVQWLVTDSGVIRYDPAMAEWTAYSESDHPVLEDVTAMLITHDGTLWLGGVSGLVRFDGVEWVTPDGDGTALDWIDDIAEAPDGSLWVTANGDLHHLDGEQWSRFGWPGSGWVESVAVAPDGAVWAGYEGLGRFDPTTGTWQIFTTEDGLVHQEVRTIYITPEGVVWVGTPGGISRFVPGE